MTSTMSMSMLAVWMVSLGGDECNVDEEGGEEVAWSVNDGSKMCRV